MKLIIHHHSLVYKDEFGFWFPSFMGSWLNEILNQIEEVAFLGEMSQAKQENQDYLINKPNFKLLSIGTRGINTSFYKKQRIQQLGSDYSSQYTQLLIRGITPRQYQVFKAFKKLPSSFLMVGSINDSRPQFKFNHISIIVWFLYYLKRFQLKRISRKARIFANSPQIIEEFKSVMKIKAEFIPTNTIQNPHFNSFIFRGFQDNPVILFCGRVVKEKGIEELIYAISALKKSGNVFRLNVVGSITKSYKIYLDNIIERENLKREVSYKGFVKFGDELLSLYRTSDIYVLPSYHEGFPHSIWEAASASTPIITTKVGGIPGLVSENEVFFTEVKSIENLKKSIEFVICNSKIANARALKAFNLAKSYSIENCVNILKDKMHNQKI